jgi:hypothetical protein
MNSLHLTCCENSFTDNQLIMKTFLPALVATAMFLTPALTFGQAPNLGSAANFVLFSTNGPLNNTGTSPLTGDIGTNNGTTSNFTNLVGSIHDQDGASALCATDLLAAYNQINNTPSTLIAMPTLGNGQVITAGSYCVSTLSTLNGTITFDGESNSNAVFIMQIQAAFSTNAGAQVNLINGAKACNVFWKIEGAVGMGAGSTMRGTVIANNGAISLSSGVTIEGRALSTTGAITVDNTTAYLPTGCMGSTMSITSPPASQTVCVNSAASFSVAASETGLTYQWRNGTTNLTDGGHISGATSPVLTFSSVNVSDISANYNVVVSGSSTLTSSFVSLGVSASPAIVLQPVNAIGCIDYDKANFWVTATGTGLTYQWRRGTINLVNGSNISGANSASLTINVISNGDIGTDYNVVVSGLCAPSGTSAEVSLSKCVATGILPLTEANASKSAIYPNPFTTSLNFESHDASQINNSEITIYNVLGATMMSIQVTKKITTIETANFPEGVYFYKVISNNETVQSGRLIAH